MFNSRLKKALQDQSAELYMLRQLIEQMNRGMLSIRLDAQTRICDFNPHFAQTLGYKDEHLRGRPLSEIVPPYVTECVKTLLYLGYLSPAQLGESIAQAFATISTGNAPGRL